MFKPISFNVIKQALAWHDIPLPVMRALSTYKWPSGSTSAEYRLLWPLKDIMLRYGEGSWHDGSAHFTQFMYDLRECFCDDITLTQLHCEPAEGTMTAILYVKVGADSQQLSLF